MNELNVDKCGDILLAKSCDNSSYLAFLSLH